MLLHSMVVQEYYRGCELGQRLMSEFERRALANGYYQAVVQVLTDNKPVCRLCRKFVYQEVSRTPYWLGLLTCRATP